MKKLASLAFVIMMVGCMFLMAAFADTVPAEVGEAAILAGDAIPIPVEATPFNWVALATIAGCAAATVLIVQYTKAFLPQAIPTRAYVYVVALAIMLLATHFTTGLNADSIFLVMMNAFVAATSALGTYDLTFAESDELKRTAEA